MFQHQKSSVLAEVMSFTTCHAQTGTLYLQRHPNPASNLSDDRSRDSRGGIALVAVKLDHWTLAGKGYFKMPLISSSCSFRS